MSFKTTIFLIIILTLVTFGLQGCGMFTTIVVEPLDKPIYVPDEIIGECKVPRPPFTVQQYMENKYSERETLLTGYTNTLIKEGALCKKRNIAIRKWNNEQKLIYNKAYEKRKKKLKIKD